MATHAASSFAAASFGAMLRHHRLAAGLSQDGLAERAGLSRNGISQLEHNLKHMPHRHTILRLADALKLEDAERRAFLAASRGQRPGAAIHSLALHHTALPLVGRQGEMAQVDASLDGRSPPLLFFAGEPGIGKSRLLAEAAARARERGWRVVSGGCMRRSGQEPYEPFVSALAWELRQTPPARQRLELQGCAWLVRLLPELLDAHIVPAPSWTLPPEQERRLMFEAVGRYLANAAGASGTLLLLDDLQWAGDDALALLARLVAETTTHEQPLRIIGAYRSTEVRLTSPLGLLLADQVQAGRAMRHAVPVLAPDEMVALFESLWHAEVATSEVPSRDEMLRLAEGLPFFLVSSVRAIQAEAHPTITPHLAASAAESVRVRVAILPDTAQEILSIAAIAGRVVSGALLVAGTTCGEAETLDGLDIVCHAGLMVEDRDDQYRFTHDMIREVVEAGLSTRRRRTLHKRVGQLMLAIGARSPADIAFHFVEAGETALALPYALLAGDQAERVFAHAEAEGYYGTALVLARKAADVTSEADILAKLCRILRLTGCYDEVFSVAESAIPLLMKLDQIERAAQLGQEAAQAEIFAATPAAHRIEKLAAWEADLTARGLSMHEQLGLRIFRSLLMIFEPHVSLPQSHASLGQVAGGIEVAQEVAGLAQAFHDDNRYAMAMYALAVGHDRFGRRQEALRARELAFPFRHTMAAWEHCQFLISTSTLHLDAGNLERCRICLEHADAASSLTGDTNQAATIATEYGILGFISGDWEQTHHCFQRALTLSAMSLSAVEANSMKSSLTRFALAEGDFANAHLILEEMLAIGAEHPHDSITLDAQGIYAEEELLAGESDRARARLEPLVARLLPSIWVAQSILPLLAWALLDHGEVALAEEYAARAVEYARQEELNCHLADSALRIWALVAARQERWDEAAAALEEAIVLARAIPYPWAELKILYVYGQLHTAKAQRAFAREAYQQALAICDRLGERLYRPQIERALASL